MFFFYFIVDYLMIFLIDSMYMYIGYICILVIVVYFLNEIIYIYI